MKRKVVQNGPLTLGVSLPSKWVKSHGIKKGDEIDVDESEGNIIIGSKEKASSETIICIPSKYTPLDEDKRPDRYFIRTIVINALRKGYNKIEIKFDNDRALSTINDCVNEVLGYEISKQGPNECIIENVVNLIENDANKYFTKLMHTISNISHLAYSNIIENKNNSEEIKSAFAMLEKNYNTFCRFLMNDLQVKTKEKMFLFEAAGHLYQAARNLFYASRSDEKLTKSSVKYAKLVFSYVDEVMKFIVSKDLSMIAELNVKKNRLTYHEVNKIMNPKESKTILQLVFVARRMWDAVGPYTGSII